MNTCPKCQAEILNKENYRRHLKYCTGLGTHKMQKTGPYTCDKCNHVFKNPENYRRHVKVCDGFGTYEEKAIGPRVCQHCNKQFYNRANHKRHIVHCEKVARINLQAEYDSGLGILQICKKYGIGKKFADNIINNKRTPQQAVQKLKEENPSNFFYGGTRRKSKGEVRFKEMLEASGLLKQYNVEEQYHLFRYKLDFAFPNIKLDVEIDGMQHYTKPEIKARDKKREAILLNARWIVYRIASKDFLARPRVVFELFEEFLKEKHPCKVFRYIGQIVDGDKRWMQEREQKILNSGIKLNEIGWAKQLGKLLNIHAESARRWVASNMPEFYRKNCRTPRADYIKRQANYG